MGTNYYHERNVCDKCGHAEARDHIGKSSAGWTFSFHALEDVRSWKDWQTRLESGGRIVDEYGEEHSLEWFKELVANKRKPWGKNGEPPLSHAAESRKERWGGNDFLDPDGESFSDHEFS